MSLLSKYYKLVFLSFSIFFGIILRFELATIGYNWDFESYLVVVSAVRDGYSPWVTQRYNYGPIWAFVLLIISYLSFNDLEVFRFILVAFLTLCDLAIAFVIYRHGYKVLAALFFLNPISVIISGYHNQFDNFAIAVFLVALYIYQNKFIINERYNTIFLLSALGISLQIKHVLIFFVLWLALKQLNLKSFILFLFLPFIIFLGGFLPFWLSSKEEIIQNVFRYQSFDNAPLVTLLGNVGLNFHHRSTFIFYAGMLIFGFLLRSYNQIESLFLYTIVIVFLSSAVANQYLAIAAIGSIVYLNLGFILYFIYSTTWLVTDKDGLFIDLGDTIKSALSNLGYTPVALTLGLGLFIIWLELKLKKYSQSR